MFIALKDNPLLHLIFQKGDTLGNILYRQVQVQHLPLIDVCIYTASRDSLLYRISFLGIDSDVECGTESNVDFVHCMEALRGNVHV